MSIFIPSKQSSHFSYGCCNKAKLPAKHFLTHGKKKREMDKTSPENKDKKEKES